MAEQTNLYPLCIPPTYVEDVFEAEYSLEDWQHALALLTNFIEVSTHIENETVTLALWESGGDRARIEIQRPNRGRERLPNR